MPVAKVELTGGNFQDSQGNVLSNGYLTMKLSSDEEVNDSLICSGIELRIQLDVNGNVTTGQFVWGNDQMSPLNSYYIVTGFTAAGQACWGPNNQQVVGNGGTFDAGTWIPNSVISWTPSPQSVLIEVNGTPAPSQTILNLIEGSNTTIANVVGGIEISSTATPVDIEVNGTPAASQAVLNLTQGANITITDEGAGEISIAATGGGVVAGTNIANLPYVIEPFISQYVNGTLDVRSIDAQCVQGNGILCSPASWRVTVHVPTGTVEISQFQVARTNQDDLNIIDWTPISIGGSFTPTLATGLNTSDIISLPIDADHDYYFFIFGPYPGTGTGNISSNGNVSIPYGFGFGGTQVESSTYPIGTATTIPVPLYQANAGVWLSYWKAA